MKKTYIDINGGEPIKDGSIPVTYHVNTWEYYMNRKGRYYFRSDLGVNMSMDIPDTKYFIKKYKDKMSIMIDDQLI